jgi:phospholipase A1
MKHSLKPAKRFAARFLGALWLSVVATTCLAAGPVEATRCAAIANDSERLRCYDELAGRGKPTPAVPGQGPSDDALRQLGAKPSPGAGVGAIRPTALSARWELDPETKQGLWNVRPHQPMFLLPVRTTNNSNDSPQSPSHPLSQSVPLDDTEAEFQLSFKTKAAENIFSTNADLWIAYTQQSQWQLYNSGISRPFRETNYQPEIFALFPTNYELFGLSGRFVSLGLVHQSNGRADPLSRSWNRVYAQFGFERGDFSLLARPWYRLKENAADDDNPDMVRYMGYGDLLAVFKPGRQEFSLLARFNPSSHYGALQGGWSFPIHERLKGYVKVFTGYGETLIDYNWKQTTIGIGVALVDWL